MVTTLGKLFTHVCLCCQQVLDCSGKKLYEERLSQSVVDDVTGRRLPFVVLTTDTWRVKRCTIITGKKENK